MPSEADAADAWSPLEGVKGLSRRPDQVTGRPVTIHLGLKVRKSLPPPVNNSLRDLIKVPCRKFFLSSLLGLFCCPVIPPGWVTFPTPRPWRQQPRVKKRTGTMWIPCRVSLLPPALATLLEAWQTRAKTITTYSSLSLLPEVPKGPPGPPIPGTWRLGSA